MFYIPPDSTKFTLDFQTICIIVFRFIMIKKTQVGQENFNPGNSFIPMNIQQSMMQ